MFSLIYSVITVALVEVASMSTPSLSDAVLRVSLVTLFIAVFGFGFAIWIRRRGRPITSSSDRDSSPALGKLLSKIIQPPPEDTIRIVSLKKIGSGQMLAEVHWNDRKLLLGSSGQSIHLLCEDSLEAED